jgi:hypothetical protein
VLFNHKAERSSFVIASAGVAIWCVSPPRGTMAPLARGLLGATALVGLKTAPLLVVWLVMQAELYGWRFATTAAADAVADPKALAVPLRRATSEGGS